MTETKKELKVEFKKQFGFMRYGNTRGIVKYKMWDIVYENMWYFVIRAIQAKEDEVVGRIVKFIDEVELSYRDTTLEEWKAFKHIRNGIRDRFLSSLKKGEKTK